MRLHVYRFPALSIAKGHGTPLAQSTQGCPSVIANLNPVRNRPGDRTMHLRRPRD